MNVALDIGCPGCGYSLRGLAGRFVRCPECGETCDLVDLAGRRHRRSPTSPGYVKLNFAAVLSVPFLVMIAAATALFGGWSVLAPFTLLFGLAMFASWAVLAWSALRRWPFGIALLMALRVEGIVLLNLVSAVLLSGALIGFLVSVVFFWLLERDDVSAIIVFVSCLLVAPLSYGGLVAAGRLDRRARRRFVKRELELLLPAGAGRRSEGARATLREDHVKAGSSSG